MATIDLFRPLSEDIIRDGLRRAKKQAHDRLHTEFETAIDYLENRQLEDVRSELQSRYRQTQALNKGQSIEPVVFDLTQRYVAEAATAYNKSVKRELVDDAGKLDEKATKIFTEEMNACAYNERLHRLEGIKCLLGTCGLWYQVKRGHLRPVIVLPHNIRCVSPANPYLFDATDPEDYLGFIVEIAYSASDGSMAAPQTYGLVTHAGIQYFEGRDAYEPTKMLEFYPNPFKWQQAADSEDQRGATLQDLPLQMLTFWHDRFPIDSLIFDTDPDIVYLNREINIAWSVILHTMRTQGWGQLVFKLLNAEHPPSTVAMGPNFGIALNPGEDVTSMGHSNDYSGMVNVLKTLTAMLAVAKRMSPVDFSLEGEKAVSGFSKLVESLPKLESRQERITRLKAMEENVAWPRIAACLKYLGKGDFSKLHLRVEFPEIEFPKSVDEETRQQEHDFKYGLSSPADVLAKRQNITKDEAQKRIDESKVKSPISPEDNPKQEEQEKKPKTLLGTLIGKKKGITLQNQEA